MPHRVVKRGTILIPSGPSTDPDRRYLFIICSDPCSEGLTVIVPVTTWTGDLCDSTCRLGAHEHDYLRHASYAFYRKTRIESVETLKNGIRENVLRPHAPCNGQTFLRVKNGICISPHTPRKIKHYLKCPPSAANNPSTGATQDAPAQPPRS